MRLNNQKPYYAVIFTSKRTDGDNDYSLMANKMVQLAKVQNGFLGLDSARENIGITVSYWQSLEDIKKWKHHIDHTLARDLGREKWYSSYTVRICEVLKEYSFSNDSTTLELD